MHRAWQGGGGIERVVEREKVRDRWRDRGTQGHRRTEKDRDLRPRRS